MPSISKQSNEASINADLITLVPLIERLSNSVRIFTPGSRDDAYLPPEVSSSDVYPVRKRTPKPHRLSHGQVSELASDNESGFTVSEIASKYGVHQSTVYRHIHAVRHLEEAKDPSD